MKNCDRLVDVDECGAEFERTWKNLVQFLVFTVRD